MRTGFPNPIEGPKGKDKKSPWDFKCPPYDERTSCYVSAGWHNGIGHRNPVGHKGDVKQRVAALPYGRINTEKTAYAPPKMLDQEYIE